VAALGDNQASFLGSVPVGRRVLLANVGTGAQVSFRIRPEELGEFARAADG
jgi:hypothetical protein